MNAEPHEIDVTRLPCYRTLKRADGQTWSSVLEPILRDTSGLTNKADLHLDQIDGLIAQLLDEMLRHPMPEFVIYTPPDDQTWDTHDKILDPWREVHGNRRKIRAELNDPGSYVYRLLWETRMGSRFYEAEAGWPLAKSVLTRLGHLVKYVPGVRETYDMLCDTTHPNLEAQALLWRTDYITVGQNNAIRFAPGRSNSRVKLYIADAFSLSLKLVLPFARDLWWIAADITNSCDITATPLTDPLGLPTRTGRNDQCSCGSGSVTRTCTHPEPTPVR